MNDADVAASRIFAKNPHHDDLFDASGMPIFDKAILFSAAVRPYHYEIGFEDRPAVDMRMGGYQKIIRPYQDGGHEVTHLGTYVSGATIYCQAKVVLRLKSGKTFEALGDADNRGSPDGDTCLRVAETAAFKRAICKALDISPIDFGNDTSIYNEDGTRKQGKVYSGKKRSSGGSGATPAREEPKGVDLSQVKLPKRVVGGTGVWDKCQK